MCPAESKVILNYDNIPDLESRYQDAVIQPYEPGHSHAKYYMADTVHMIWKRGLSKEQMTRMAKEAAPLASRVVIDGMPDDVSRDRKKGIFPVRSYAYAM